MAKDLNKEENINDLEQKRKIVLDFIGEEDKKKKNEPIEAKNIVVSEKIKTNEDQKKILNKEEMEKAKNFLGLEEKKFSETKEIKKVQPFIKEEKVKEALKENNDFSNKKIETKAKIPKKLETKRRVKKHKNLRQTKKKAPKLKKIESTEKPKKDKNFLLARFFKKLFSVYVLLLAVFLLFIYLLYSFLVINFNIKYLDNFTKIIYVPAVISELGCLDYNSAELIKEKEGDYYENIAATLILIKLAKDNNINYQGNLMNLKQILVAEKIMNPNELENYLENETKELKIWFLN